MLEKDSEVFKGLVDLVMVIANLASMWHQTNTHLAVFMIPTLLLPSLSQHFFSLAEIRPVLLSHTYLHTYSRFSSRVVYKSVKYANKRGLREGKGMSDRENWR